MMPQFVLAHSTRSINLVSENKEWNLGQLLNGQQCVELRLRFRETLEVGGIDEEDDAINLREVVTPQTTC